jgi:hypothetical protein
MIGSRRESAGPDERRSRETIERWSAVALLAIAVLAAGLFFHARFYDYVVDDAYISFRYAQNLVAGEGLVFNPGERVEGYTNFLWVMLIALGTKLGIDPVGLAKTLGFGFAVLTMLLVYSYYGRIYQRRSFERLLPAALIASSPPFAVWALGSLETTMFAFLVTGALLTHIDSGERGRVPLASSVLIGLAALTRPEGMVFAAILFTDLLIKPGLRRRAALWLIPIALIYVPYFAWRYTYYGWLFPNTFYAKTGGGWNQFLRGLAYVRDFLFWPGGVVTLLAIVPAVLRRSRKTVLPLLTCLIWSCYVMVIGGDGLAMYRFLVPVLPIAYLLSSDGLFLLIERGGTRLAVLRGRPARLALAVLCLLMVFSRSLGSSERDFVIEDRIRVQGNWVPIGKWLGDYARPGETLAIAVAGAIPYYSGLYTIDILGITDSHIAHVKIEEMGTGTAGHEKHDIDYVLARRPTYFFHYPFMVRRAVIDRHQFEDSWYPGIAGLPDNQTFLSMYEPVSEQMAGLRINFFRLRPEFR